MTRLKKYITFLYQIRRWGQRPDEDVHMYFVHPLHDGKLGDYHEVHMLCTVHERLLGASRLSCTLVVTSQPRPVSSNPTPPSRPRTLPDDARASMTRRLPWKREQGGPAPKPEGPGASPERPGPPANAPPSRARASPGQKPSSSPLPRQSRGTPRTRSRRADSSAGRQA